MKTRLGRVLNSLYWKFYRYFSNNIFFYKGLKKWDLIVFDDIFPHPQSGFRISEIGFLLKNIKNIKIISTNHSYRLLKDNNSNQKKYLADFIKKNSEIISGNRITTINLSNFNDFFKLRNINSSLFYCIFLKNIYVLLPKLEKFKIPFVFTLYPGGGFAFDNPESDLRLRKVLNSAYFRNVIVSQKTTYDYLIKNNFCPPEKIKYIFGCAVPQNSISYDVHDKIYYPQKKQLDICFCAGRYTKDGSDKGYPIFIEMMKYISERYSFTTFHVIGGYDTNVIDITGYEDRIKFYGYRPFTDLAKIYSQMDIIVSPNQSNILAKGAFDGFPLGTLVEAALNGVMVMSCDPNNENYDLQKKAYYFQPNKEIIIINPDVEDVIQKVEQLIQNSDSIKEIGIKGHDKFKKIYNDSYQMNKRVSIITENIKINKND